jgi:ABC-2 type transport system permease protein
MHPAHGPGHSSSLDRLIVQRYLGAAVDEPAGALRLPGSRSMPRRSRLFDRRLVLAGYRPAALISAKTGAALVQAVAIGVYAAAILLFCWRSAGIWTIAVTFILAAATYAALGLLIGVMVRGDLEGFFLIIMISLIDAFLQNPVGNPLANKPLLQFFPSYAPTQVGAAGAFAHQVLVGMAALSLAWTAAFALLGLAVLRLRMPGPPA